MSIVNHDEPWPAFDSFGSGYGVKRKRISSGGNGWGSPHPYQATHEHWNAPLISESFTFGGYVYPPVEKSSQGEPVFTYTDLTNRTLNNLFGKIKGADFNAAISGAELPKSIKMIGDSALKIGRAYKQAKKGLSRGLTRQSRKQHFADASRTLTGKGGSAEGKVANNWLELQYGWLPLVNDMYEGSKFVESKLQTIKQDFRVGSEVDETALFYGERYAAKQCKRRMQIIVDLTEQVPLSAQLGLTDPASVAWELMPYSFVIDWALPIGPWLSAATAARTLKGLTCSTHYLRTEVSGLQGDQFYVRSGGGTFHLERVFMDRSVGGTVPNASLPSFRPLEKVASVGHTLNALALLNRAR